MNEDRELLELAAKAAGYNTGHHWNAERLKLIPPVDSLVVILPDGQYHTAWNPLTDDGDALRLAAKLRIGLEYENDPSGEFVTAQRYALMEIESFDSEAEIMTATRRAIVMAAAEMARVPV